MEDRHYVLCVANLFGISSKISTTGSQSLTRQSLGQVFKPHDVYPKAGLGHRMIGGPLYATFGLPSGWLLRPKHGGIVQAWKLDPKRVVLRIRTR